MINPFLTCQRKEDDLRKFEDMKNNQTDVTIRAYYGI